MHRQTTIYTSSIKMNLPWLAIHWKISKKYTLPMGTTDSEFFQNWVSKKMSSSTISQLLCSIKICWNFSASREFWVFHRICLKVNSKSIWINISITKWLIIHISTGRILFSKLNSIVFWCLENMEKSLSTIRLRASGTEFFGMTEIHAKIC